MAVACIATAIGLMVLMVLLIKDSLSKDHVVRKRAHDMSMALSGYPSHQCTCKYSHITGPR